MIKIRASELATFDYCEYFLYLQSEKGDFYFNKQPEYLFKGIEAHKLLDEKFLRQTTRKMSMRKLLVSKGRIRTRPDASGIMLQAKLGDINLIGKMDEIVSDITGVYVIDDKPHYQPYKGYQNQVRTYCFLLQENFKKELGHKQLFSMLRNTQTQEVFWREAFSEEVKEELIKTLTHISNIKRAEIQPRKAVNKAKCYSCRYAVSCKGV